MGLRRTVLIRDYFVPRKMANAYLGLFLLDKRHKTVESPSHAHCSSVD